MTTQGKITAIQNEIAAAQNEIARLNRLNMPRANERRIECLTRYIKGLNVALYLLVQETAVMEVEAELVY